MKLSWPVEFIGTGVGVPEQVVTNDELARRLDTNDNWIVTRTGVRERRMAGPGESTLTLATRASREALEEAGLSPDQIDLILCATITPDHPLPSTACELQAALGSPRAAALDLVAACSGFVFGVITASQYVCSGMSQHALVVGADCMSRMADWEDRASCILFGDAAGAGILRRSTNPDRGILAARMQSDGSRAELIWVPAGGAKEPATLRTVNERLHFMRMKGREVYKFAVTQMQDLIVQTLDDAGVKMSDIDMLVPHQSNLRIIESACEKMGVPDSKVVVNIQKYGNTSAASVPLAFHEARRQGRVRPGHLVLMVAFGAGLTWGSILIRM
ncbi:MAG: beta-ketoacyl-ACP synthase III [Phycisphaerae bacterium]